MKPMPNTASNGSNKPQTPNILLPNDLANRILDLELDMQGSTISKQAVLELLGLYSEAMEFYEEHNDQKYKHFEHRIHNLLKRSEVNEVINGKAVDNANRDKAIVEGRTCAERSAKEQAKTIIKYYNVEIEKQTTRIVKQLDDQKQKILQRVKTRSLSKNKLSRPDTASSKTDPKAQNDKQNPMSRPPLGKIPNTSKFLDQIQDFKLPERRTVNKQP